MRRGAGTLFLGSYTNKIDAKGRLATPARFRRVLEKEEASEIYLIPSSDEPCLEGGGPDYIETLMASISDLPRYSEARRSLQRTISVRTTVLAMDGEGRIVLPPALREHARLEGEAAFAGNGDHFQIWNPALLEAAIERDAAAAADAKLTLDAGSPAGAAA